MNDEIRANRQPRPIEAPQHYQTFYTRPLTSSELASGKLKLKLDPYRIADILNLGGGAREQIFKKSARWDTKGQSEREVLNEIMQACTRRLEMLNEDETPLSIAPPAAPPPPAPVVPVQGDENER